MSGPSERSVLKNTDYNNNTFTAELQSVCLRSAIVTQNKKPLTIKQYYTSPRSSLRTYSLVQVPVYKLIAIRVSNYGVYIGLRTLCITFV